MLWPPTPAQCARGYTRTTQKFRIKPYYASRAARILQRHYSNTLVSREAIRPESKARYSEIGIQHLSEHTHAQVFPNRTFIPRQDLVDLSREHLRRHELLGKTNDDTPPVDLDLPPLNGDSLDEHFHRIALHEAANYLNHAKHFAVCNTPARPRKWIRRSGWTKYNPDMTTEEIDAPDEAELSFDVETLWKESPYAVMATAVSPNAWYAWISPWLLRETENRCQLIPLGDPSKERIIVGHNVGYDRARIKEEYDIRQSKNFFLDTMSLHVAVNGMCSRQRPTWMKHQKNRNLREKMSGDEQSAELQTLLENRMLSEEEEELWVGRSSINSLRDVAKFHCGVNIDKTQRDYFSDSDRDGICAKLEELLDYCAADVDITHKVFRKVFPNFLETCPHPVSFSALRHMSTVILPVNETWDQYLKDADRVYNENLDNVLKRLIQLSDAAVAVKEQPDVYTADPWLNQLDWSGQEIKYKKATKKNPNPEPYKKQKKPGMPNWYKDLFATNDAEIALTVRTRIAPLLLKLSFDGYPLFWSDVNGWTFRVPVADLSKFENGNLALADMQTETNLVLKDDRQHIYYKLPHKDGPTARCASPLAKGYLQYFESGKLSSQYPLAKEALEMNASCSYWVSARDRIKGQMVVKDADKDESLKGKSNVGYILPQVIPMGTITRRAVENTWLTASNAKKNRVGSELKAMVRAPPGYCFVGADVDSEELWIASLVGDAQFQLHGGNALGFMTLEGTKAAGTDLHSKTAKILGISRNDAKVFNYGRIYGAGLKFAATLLRQFNPSLNEKDTTRIANNLYAETKGTKTRRKLLNSGTSFWRGGTESLVFNKLEEFAEQERPRTPVLGAGITEALMRRFINQGSFMTSRINWAIQSSGVDYLHLLITSMNYLIKQYSLDARLAITVHDEIRYLVAEKDKYRAAMALQISNIWTRAMFAQQMGIDDLPQSCAFFSAVDIDSVLRKEVDMDCITPSHPKPIPHGETLDITQLLAKGDEAYLSDHIANTDLSAIPYRPRQSVMAALDAATGRSETDTTYLRAQICNDDKELVEIVRSLQFPTKENKSSWPTILDGEYGIDTENDSGAAKNPSSTSKRTIKSSTAKKSTNDTVSAVKKRPGRPKKPQVSPIPAHAQPQRAVLMEVEDRWSLGYKSAFAAANAKSKLPWWVGKPSAIHGSVKGGLDDGWEV